MAVCRVKQGLWLCLVMAGCLLLAGCHSGPKKPADLPELVPCTILVKYKGSPVDGAKVMLQPVSGRRSAAGLTGSDGRAVMKTDGTYNGVVPGDYRVAIVKQAAAETQAKSSSELTPEEYAKSLEAKPSQPQHLLPPKYASFESSGLTISVKAGEPAEKVIDLQD